MFFRKAREKKVAMEKEAADLRMVSLRYDEYINSSELDEFAQKEAAAIAGSINRINRELPDMHNVISSYHIYSSFPNKIAVSSNIKYNNTGYDLKQIKAESYNERHALCLAFETMLKRHIQRIMPKDRSGTEYTLTMKDNSNGVGYVSVDVTYSAINGLFKTETQREQETKGLVAKYINNPITLKAASNFADWFIEEIKQLDRDIKKGEIQCQYSLAASFLPEGYCNGVLFYYGNELKYLPYHVDDEEDRYVVNFFKENLKPIGSSEEMCAFVKAISIHAESKIKEKYIKDESGSNYSLKITELQGELEHHMAHYGCIICFDYSAKNSNYTAPREW